MKQPDDQIRPPSRTQKKKQALALQDMGTRLSEFSEDRIRSLDLSEDLTQALISVKTMKTHGARRRQFQRIGALMRDADVSAIETMLTAWAGEKERSIRLMKAVENWRDALVTGDNDVFEQLVSRFASLDRQHVLNLVRNAKKEADENRPPKAARALFRYLKSLALQSDVTDGAVDIVSGKPETETKTDPMPY